MSAPVLDAATLAFLKEAAYFIRAAQIHFSAMYAVCLWDWVVSLKREIRYIWNSPWSIIKVLYLFCRYWVLIVMPYVLWVYIEDHTEEECYKLYRSPVALAMWNQLWAEGVLLVRTYAFLGSRRSILFPLLACLGGVVAYQLYVDITQMTLLPFINPPTGPCFPTVRYAGSQHIMWFFIAPLMYDALVTGLTLWRAFQLRKSIGNSSGSPLLKTFVSEGLYYFVIISAANLVNAIFYLQPKQTMSALNIPLSIMFPDILACRMILALRETGEARQVNTSHEMGVRGSSGRGGSGFDGKASVSKSAKRSKSAQLVSAVHFNHGTVDYGQTTTTGMGGIRTVELSPEDEMPDMGSHDEIDAGMKAPSLTGDNRV